MKKVLLALLMITLLFIFGCKEKDENKVDSERVTAFDKMIVELQGAVKKDITVSVVSGIYIKTANRIEVYHLSEASGLSFEEKVALILNMDKNSEVSYIVLNNSYVTWKNYKNIDDFSGASSILNIIGAKTVVYNMIGKKEIYADGTAVPFVPVTGYVDNSKNYSYTRNIFPVGGGIDSPIDYTRSHPFVDLIKTIEGWGLSDSPWSLGIIKTDANGWPNEDFGVMLFRAQAGLDVKGIYKMSFECSVLPEVRTIASPGEISNLVRDEKMGIVTGDITIENQDQLFLSFKNTNGGVRNLKVLRPGYTQNQTFTKEYLDHLDRFAVIRTMDFTFTNGNTQEKWSDRKLPLNGPTAYGTQTGAAWEYCIELANTVKADLWINIPHKADADYVRNLAILIKSQLNPDLNIYFEYSNENWNWMFPQSNWTLEAANKPPYLSKLSYDGETYKSYFHWRFIGEKIKECSDIFAEVWGKDQINKRVRPVLSAQMVYGITYSEPLKYLRDNYGEPSNYIYGVAGAPYFNMGDIQTKEGLTVDEVIAALDKCVNEQGEWLELLGGFAQEYNLKMLAYEGGPDTFGDGSLIAKEAAQKDPRIKAIVMKYMENWYYSGGDVLNWFFAGASDWSTKYGAWGLLNNPKEDIGPKIEGIDAVIAGGMSKYSSGQIIAENPVIDTTKSATLIDFNSLTATGVDKFIGKTLSVGDYTFKCNSDLSIIKELGWDVDYITNVLHVGSWGGELKIVKTDGKPFSLKSIKLLRPFNTNQISSVKITGYMYARGSIKTIVEIPISTGRNGLEFIFPDTWAKVGMKEIRFEFMELAGGLGELRYGAIDDVEIYETVLE